MNKPLQKLLLWLLIFAIFGNTFLINPVMVRATPEPTGVDGEDTENSPDLQEGPGPDLDASDIPEIPYESLPEENLAFEAGEWALRYTDPSSLVTLDDILSPALQPAPESTGMSGSMVNWNNVLPASQQQTKLVFRQYDLDAVKAMYCASQMMPEFNDDFVALYDGLIDNNEFNKTNPKVTKDDIISEIKDDIISEIKTEIMKDPSADLPEKLTDNNNKVPNQYSGLIPFINEYFATLKFGVSGATPEILQANRDRREKFRQLTGWARGVAGSDWKNTVKQKLRPETIREANQANLRCLTGLTEGELQEYLSSTNAEKINELVEVTNQIIDNLAVVDTRVLKTLVYLVTPKNQGGAGHWRVKVRKLVQPQSQPYSNESYATLSGKKRTSNDPCEGKTAAECGQLRQAQGSDSFATVEDQDGQESEAYLNTTSEDIENDAASGINISAHAEGKAVDISEIDDIRCTLKKSRIIGSSSKTAQPTKGIKLAWQTENGYNSSSGVPGVDLNDILRSMASESIGELLAESGRDVSDYNGDLSRANYTDILELVGRTLFAEIVDGPIGFSGINIGDTLEQLGKVYFTDYLGIPRDAILDRKIETLEDLHLAIGQAAVEARLDLPFGSLSGNDLESIFINIAQRKIEYETDLKPGDLDELPGQKPTTAVFSLVPDDSLSGAAGGVSYLVGKRAIENALYLDKGTLDGKMASFNDFKHAVGTYKMSLISTDPNYLDGILHMPAGSSQKLKDNKVREYINDVGNKRMDDTAYGLQFFSAHDAMYSVPAPTKINPSLPNRTPEEQTVQNSTWARALLGERGALKAIGINIITRSFGQSDTYKLQTTSIAEVGQEVELEAVPRDFGIEAMRQWLTGNVYRTDKKPSQGETTQTVQIKVKTNLYTIPTSAGSGDGAAAYYTEAVDHTDPANANIGYRGVYKIVEKKVAINENKAREIGLKTFDLFQLFGYVSANGKAVYQRIGNELLFYALINKQLSKDGKGHINLEQNPTIHSDNPKANFYLTRLQRARVLAAEIKNEWKDEGDGAYKEIKEHTDNIFNAFEGFKLSDAGNIIRIAKEVIPEIGILKAKLEVLRGIDYEKATRLSQTLADADELYHLISEIIAGHPIQKVGNIKANQIKTEGIKNGAGNSQKSRRIDPLTIYALITGQIRFADFFLHLGGGQVEDQIQLPRNSLVYYVKNIEIAGFRGIDAFYQSIGQAQIEESFGMPDFYFQGYTVPGERQMPRFDRDTTALKRLLFDPNDSTKYRQDIADLDTPFSALTAYPPSKFGEIWATLRTNEKSGLDPYKTFSRIIKAAQNLWRADRQRELDERGRDVFPDKDLDDLLKNLVGRGYAADTAAAKRDLLLKLGLPTDYDSLSSSSIGAWTLAGNRAQTIDRQLDITAGSTRELITKTQRFKFDLTKDELELFQAKMGISKEALQVFLRLLNGEITLQEMEAMGMSAEYTTTNPYAPGNSSCQVNYRLTEPDKQNGSGKFVVNETTLDPNSYCYYDQAGRHCFKSSEEAQRYSNEHADRRLDALGVIARGLVNAESQIADPPTEIDLDRIARYRRLLLDFAAGRIDTLGDNIALINLAARTDIPISALLKIFRRTDINKPLQNYKIAVGKSTAKKIVSWKLFSQIGVRLPANSFGPDDLYEILSGNLRPLYRLGASYLDQENKWQPGTSLMIYRALTDPASVPDTVSCALAQAGATILGNIVGLESVPLFMPDGSFQLLHTIGEAKVEETLKLPRGTFFGSYRNDTTNGIEGLQDLIARVKPINFALAFKIPVRDDNRVFTASRIEEIVGADYARQLSSLSPWQKLEKIRDYVAASYALKTTALTAMKNLEEDIHDEIFAFLSKVRSADDTIAPPGQNASRTDKQHYEDIKTFYSNLKYIDSIFNLDKIVSGFADISPAQPYTFKLLTRGKDFDGTTFTPSDYIEQVGRRVGQKLAAVEIFEALGLSDDKANAAAELSTNISRIFKCSDYDLVGGKCRDSLYQNWGDLYRQIDALVPLRLDEHAKLEPGTMQRVMDNPNSTHIILLPQAAKKLDEMLKLNPNNHWSISELSRQLLPSLLARQDANALIEESCRRSVYPDDAAERHRIRIEALRPVIATQSGDIAENAKIELAQIQREIAEANQKIQACKAASARRNETAGQIDIQTHEDGTIGKLTKIGIEFVKDGVAKEIQRQIREETCLQKIGDTCVNFVDMPLNDIKALIFRGDLEYLGIALMAYGLNFLYVEKPDGSMERKMASPGMRITYDDLRLAFLGDAAANQHAVDAATWGHIHGTLTQDTEGNIVANPEAASYGYGDVCPEDSNFVVGTVRCMSSDDFNQGIGMERNNATLVGGNQGITDAQFNVDPRTPDFNHQGLETYASGVNAKPNDLLSEYNNNNNRLTNDPNLTSEERQRLSDRNDRIADQVDADGNTLRPGELSIAMADRDRLNAARRDAPKISRKAFMQDLQYRMMDFALWKLDDNIFPGFTRALMQGSGRVKTLALATYVKNGLKNGHIGPIKFHGVDWEKFVAEAQIALFVNDLLAGNMTQANFEKFAATPGFSRLSEYITNGLTHFFDMSSPVHPDFIKGVLVGIFTSDWGFRLGTDGTSIAEPHKIGNTEVPTVGSAFMQYLQTKIFAGADKGMGLPPGTTQQIFDLGVKIYKAARLYVQAQHALKIAENKLTEAMLAGSDDAIGQAVDGVNTAIDKTAAAVQALAAAIKAFVAFALNVLVQKLLGDEIAVFEQSIGLVPGSLMVLVGIAIDFVATIATQAILNALNIAVNVSWMGPLGLAIGIVMFIAMNLWGWRKIEYRCTADGYQPFIENPTSSSIVDTAPQGEWEVMSHNNPQDHIMKRNVIAAAQYKAQRLLRDLLEMQYNPRFNDVTGEPTVPVQIMTGRQEDVDALNREGLITNNLCRQRLGDDSKAGYEGICDETRIGIWKNPQTIQWTHVGF